MFFSLWHQRPKPETQAAPCDKCLLVFLVWFRTLGVSKDWGAFIVIRNRHNAPTSHAPNNSWIFFFNHLPLSPEINPVWAIDAVWPFGCNFFFFLIFLQSPQLPWGGVGGPEIFTWTQVLRRLATKWGYREASKPVHRASVCGDFSLPRTLDACSPRSSGPVSEGGVFERRPPNIKGKETGSAAAVSQRRRECASVW